jgi:hypothetical protein
MPDGTRNELGVLLVLSSLRFALQVSVQFGAHAVAVRARGGPHRTQEDISEDGGPAAGTSLTSKRAIRLEWHAELVTLPKTLSALKSVFSGH